MGSLLHHTERFTSGLLNFIVAVQAQMMLSVLDVQKRSHLKKLLIKSMKWCSEIFD